MLVKNFEVVWNKLVYQVSCISKASYDIQVPHVGAPKTSHLLPENVVERITGMTQRPMNPHKQRLLASEMRSATLPKEKNTGKKPKSSSSSKRKEVKGASDPESSRSAYSKSKRDFMDKFLEPIWDCQHASIDFIRHAQILSHLNLFSQGWLRRILDWPRNHESRGWCLNQNTFEVLPLVSYLFCIFLESLNFPITIRWKESQIFEDLINKMGKAEAKRRRYI